MAAGGMALRENNKRRVVKAAAAANTTEVQEKLQSPLPLPFHCQPQVGGERRAAREVVAEMEARAAPLAPHLRPTGDVSTPAFPPEEIEAEAAGGVAGAAAASERAVVAAAAVKAEKAAVAPQPAVDLETPLNTSRTATACPQ